MDNCTVAGTSKDPTVRFSTLELKGEKYKLAFDFNAIAEAEATAGCNLLVGLENLLDLNAKQLRGLLYAALLVAHPQTTVQDAGKMIKPGTLGVVTKALGEAYILSMPDKKEEPDPQPASAQAAE